MWYAVHAVMSVVYKKNRQRTFPVWENIYTIWADSQEEAASKGKTIALREEGDSEGTMTYNGYPACWKFEGIRQVMEFEHSCMCGYLKELDGVEVSYNEYVFTDRKSLKDFSSGKPLKLRSLAHSVP